MDIIDAKKKEIDGLSRSLIYDGKPSGHKWSSQATFITSQNTAMSDALARVGRSFDNLYIRTNVSERWHVFSSKGKQGEPPIAFVFWYNRQGFTSFVYVGWEKFKTADIINMDPVARDALLTASPTTDIKLIWRKDRSLTTIGGLLRTLPKDQVDASLKMVSKNLLSNVEKAELNNRNTVKVASLVSSLRDVGTPSALAFIGKIEQAFKDGSLKQLLTDMKKGHYRTAKINLDDLRKIFQWPELDGIRRSLTALGYYGDIDESAYSGEHPAIVRAKRVLTDEVPGGNYWAVSRAIGHMKEDNISPEQIRKVLEWHRPEIIQSQEFLLSQEMSQIQGGLACMVDLIEAGINWPEFDGILDRNKDGIMHAVLWEVAHIPDGYDPLLYTYLVQLGVKWPEMAIIQRSLDANKKNKLKENLNYVEAAFSIGNHNDPRALERYISDMRYDGMSDLRILNGLKLYDETLGTWIDEVLSKPGSENYAKQMLNFMVMGANWPHVKAAIEKHRDVIIRYALVLYKDSLNAQWSAVKISDIRQMLKHAKESGYDWPEFDAIIVSSVSR